ncbi:MAG TPA: serine hydrolase, partial [Candidatus Dojkabacteria bacterium]|nr:serine hydrolase [Candidatus Dojkabacteria bacterium]
FKQNEPLNSPNKIVKFHDTSITSTSYIVYDLNRNMTLDSKNINQKRAIASMTKLVTALVVLDNYDLSSKITVTQPIPSVDRRLGIKVGDTVVVNNLLNAMLVYSANDAAIIFANEYSNGGYTGFVKAMNDKAKELGMASSHFSNPSGFYDDNNYSTAKDMLKLSLVTSGENRITKVTSQPFYTLTYQSKQLGTNVTQTLISTDELLPANQYVKGLKTGFTYASGPSFTSYWVKGKERFLIVVMNSQDRFGEALRLFNDSISL